MSLPGFGEGFVFSALFAISAVNLFSRFGCGFAALGLGGSSELAVFRAWAILRFSQILFATAQEL